MICQYRTFRFRNSSMDIKKKKYEWSNIKPQGIESN